MSETPKAQKTNPEIQVTNGDISLNEINIDIDEKQRPKSSDISTEIDNAVQRQVSASQKAASEKKLGHRRVDNDGQVTYKKVFSSLFRFKFTEITHTRPTTELMAAIQLGIGQSVTQNAGKPKCDLLLQDFTIVDSVFFPSEGSGLTPAHHYSDFRFKAYAPIAFRYFRELFSIQPDDFLLSMCNDPLTELSNPGASGSIFYITEDDEFIIKTLQHKEAEFLQKLLPGYYMNLVQNTRTLLPKFYGLFCYQCGGKNIRFIVMNNLLPMSVRLHEKYDLKGSSYKRRASKSEKSKKSPTLKDLDFLANHPDGISLEADTYNALVTTIQRDCRVLQSFQIMDYSLLVGIHNLDVECRERAQAQAEEADVAGTSSTTEHNRGGISRGKSMKQRVAQFSTAMESIQATTEPLVTDTDNIPSGGIPARNAKGERLFLYIGVIDVLQNYRIAKKMEHAFKAMLSDGDTISVHRPGFYAQRFQNFFSEKVFKKIPNPLKHSPSKRRSNSTCNKNTSDCELTQQHQQTDITETIVEEPVTTSDRPDLLHNAETVNTPPNSTEENPTIRYGIDNKYNSPEANMVIQKKHQEELVLSDKDKEKTNKEQIIVSNRNTSTDIMV